MPKVKKIKSYRRQRLKNKERMQHKRQNGHNFSNNVQMKETQHTSIENKDNLSDTVELEEPQLTGILIAAAPVHQASVEFNERSRGKQCTAMAYAAIARSLLHSPSTWNSDTLLQIMHTGDDIYNTVQHTYEYLHYSELPETVSFSNTVVHLKIDEPKTGVLSTSHSTDFSTLEDAVSNCRRVNSVGLLLTTCGYTTAIIWAKQNSVYVFDSHARNAEGMFSNAGSAVLLKFQCSYSLVGYIRRLYDNWPQSQFDCVPVFYKRTNNTEVQNYVNFGENSLSLKKYFLDQFSKSCKKKDQIKTDRSHRKRKETLEETGFLEKGQKRCVDKDRKRETHKKRNLVEVLEDRRKDRERKKQAREKRDVIDLQEERKKDRDRKRQALEKRTDIQIQEERTKDKNKKKQAREKRTLREIQEGRNKDKDRKNQAREKRLDIQIQKERSKDKDRKNQAREKQDVIDLQEDRKKDRDRKRQALVKRTDIQIQEERNKDKNKRKQAREKRTFREIQEGRNKDKDRKNQAREKRLDIQIQKERSKDKDRKHQAREKQDVIDLQEDRKKDRDRKRQALVKRTDIQIQEERNKDKNKKKQAREKRTLKEIQVGRNKDKDRKNQALQKRTDIQIQEERTKDKNKKKQAREKRTDIQIQEERNKDMNRKKEERNKKNKINDAITEFSASIKNGPNFICTCCWRELYRRSVVHVNKNSYNKLSAGDLDKCLSGQISEGKEWICNTCHQKLKQGKFPKQAVCNDLVLDDIPDCLSKLCTLELQLICKVIPFMKIVSLPRGAQHGIRGQVVLVPADLKKVTSNLPRPTSESQIIALALKRRLSDKQYVKKQYIRPHFVNAALRYLKRNSSVYSDVEINGNWQQISEKDDVEFWNAVMHTDDDTIQDSSAGEPVNKERKVKTSTEIIDSEDEVEMENSDEFLYSLHNTRQINSETCIQPINGPEVHTNEILNLAPAEGQFPLSASAEPMCEAMAFPKLFPKGRNTFHIQGKRQVPISLKQYINARLLSKDHRFAESPEYAFMALDWVERETVKQNISIILRKRFQEDISVGQFKDPERITKLLNENQLFTTFKNIRGTPQYFNQMHLDMLAKLRQYGPYTFFISGSAAEFHWPEVIQVVGKQYGQVFSEDDILTMNWETKRTWLQRNPVTVARHIDYIFQMLWGKVLLSGTHPIGQILNYDLRKEMQGRGTAHFHSAVHIEGAPKLDVNSDEEFVAFADQHISCEMPDERSDPELYSLVSSRQQHHHTRTCKKKKGVPCRFSYPRPPSLYTVLARVPNEENTATIQKEASDVLAKIYTILSSLDTTTSKECPTFQELLQTANLTETVYHKALQVAHRRTQIIMKRSPAEIFINNYNPTILRCLRSNMDIQMITSIWACIAYITSYICKPEKTMSELMHKASKDAQEKTIKGRLYHIANQLRKGREVSHHETILRLISIPLRCSNNAVTFIATDFKENRTRIVKPMQVLQSLQDEDTDVYVVTIHEKYAARPDSLEDISLAEFVANYSMRSNKEDKEEQTETEDNSTHKFITLKNSLGRMYKRKSPQVIRYHYVSKERDEELYYHRLLLLYLPWRKEDELLKNNSYKSKFREVKQVIVPTVQRFEPYYEEVEDVIDNFDPEDLQPDVWEQVAAQAEQDKDDPRNVVEDSSYSFLDPDNIPDESHTATTSSSQQEKNYQLTTTYQISDDNYFKLVCSLNEKQRYFFDFMFKWATDTRLLSQPQMPFYIFLSGGAGVGKSHLIHAVYQGLIRALRCAGQNPEQPTVILTASTGKAAVNINGTTLHSAFNLPVKMGRKKKCQYRKSSTDKLNTLRSNYLNLKVIIADEISMFGQNSLENLNKSLQDIFQDYKNHFAGVSILAVGDLFQLPAVGDGPIFNTPMAGYAALAGSLWSYFHLFELTEIVRQKGDPLYADVLSRVRTGCMTDDDIKLLSDLSHTPVDNFPPDTVHIFLTNQQVDCYNNSRIASLPDKVTLHACDSKRDLYTNKVPIQVKLQNIYQTGGLPSTLMIAKNAKVMITKNIDIADRLVNGSIGIIEHIDINFQQPLNGIIYLKFQDEHIGREARKTCPINFKHCVPIKAVTSMFLLTDDYHCDISVERKMYPLTLAFAITVHKSQGSTYSYAVADLAPPSSMKSLMQGQAYTVLSRVTSRDGLLLLNFTPDKVKVNHRALQEIERMRTEASFQWSHPLHAIRTTSDIHIGFLNIRSLNAHATDLQAHKDIYYLSCLCLTETHVSTSSDQHGINGFNLYLGYSTHGLAMYFKEESTHYDFICPESFQFMARLLKITEPPTLIAVTYKPPDKNRNEYLNQLQQILHRIPKSFHIILGGDFNMTPDDPAIIQFCKQSRLIQKIDQPTHYHGRALDLIFTSPAINTTPLVFPLPYTDHFITCVSFPKTS